MCVCITRMEPRSSEETVRLYVVVIDELGWDEDPQTRKMASDNRRPTTRKQRRMHPNTHRHIHALMPSQHKNNHNTKNSSVVESRLALIHRIQTYLTQKFQVYSGTDSDGNEYESIEEFWKSQGFLDDDDNDDDDDRIQWYKASHRYWEHESNAPATIDGMLGGFSVLSERDLIASEKFLKTVLTQKPLLYEKIKDPQIATRACECGAGIGRVTKGLLLKTPLAGMDACDLVEPSSRLLLAAPTYLGDDYANKCRFLCQGLQEFVPSTTNTGTTKYDIVWIQWVIAYLTDWDLVGFLIRMKEALTEDGIIIIKDNTCNDLAFMSDRDDSDITRSYQYLRAIIQESGLRVVTAGNNNKEEEHSQKKKTRKELVQWQDDFPSDIWPVPMIALERSD